MRSLRLGVEYLPLRRVLPLVLVSTLAILFACNTNERTEVSAPINASVETVLRFGEKVTVRVPAGALPEGAVLTISNNRRPPGGQLDEAQAVGSAYNIDTGGEKLQKPITVEIAYDPKKVPSDANEALVFLAFYDDQASEWMPIGGRVDLERHVVIVETDHLSWWNPFTWNWDAWIAVLKKTLTLRLSEWLEVAQTLTRDCIERGAHVTADNSGGENTLKGCITADSPSSPEVEVINLKSFFVGVYSALAGARSETVVIGPGESKTFSFATNFQPPFAVFAEFTEPAMWRMVAGLVARMLPAGDLVPDDGIQFLADGLQRVFSATDLSEELNKGDKAGVAESLYELLAGEGFVDTFVRLASEYGRRYGVSMMTKWDAALIKAKLITGSVEVIITATDFLANYLFQYFFDTRPQVSFHWTSGPVVTPSPEPTSIAVGFDVQVGNYLEQTGRMARDGWRDIGVFLDVEYRGGLQEDDEVIMCDLIGPTLEVRLSAPNGGEYALEPDLGDLVLGCMQTAPELKWRVYVHGAVPSNLASLEGSTIQVDVIDAFTREEFYSARALPLAKGVAFQPGRLQSSAVQFGGSVTIEGGSLTVSRVSPTSSGVEVTYNITNTSPYDLVSPLNSGTVVDSEGFPYVLFGLSFPGCAVPPGQTRSCQVVALGSYGPPNHEFVLGPGVLVVLKPGNFAFRP